MPIRSVERAHRKTDRGISIVWIVIEIIKEYGEICRKNMIAIIQDKNNFAQNFMCFSPSIKLIRSEKYYEYFDKYKQF